MELSSQTNIPVSAQSPSEPPCFYLTSQEPPTHARGYSYSLAYIQLCYSLLQQGLSPRSVTCVLSCLANYAPLDFKSIAAYTSINGWRLKIEQGDLEAPKRKRLKGSYALITDISMSVGKRRLLVMVAIDLGSWKFDRALRISDIEVVGLHVQPTFKGKDIHRCLLQLGREHPDMTVDYVVSDQGPELINGIARCGMKRVADVHHFFAKELRNHYTKTPEYEAFISEVSSFKFKNNMNDFACLRPPRLGHHSRFMSIGNVAKWAKKLLDWQIEGHTPVSLHRFHEASRWLEKHRFIINQLLHVTATGHQLLKVLKTQGLSWKSLDQCGQILNEAGLPPDVEQRYCRYFDEQLKNFYADEGRLSLVDGTLICSSDVVESLFGIYKYRTAKHLDSRYLSLINYGASNLKKETLKYYLERITTAEAHERIQELLVDQIKENRKAIQKDIRRQKTTD